MSFRNLSSQRMFEKLVLEHRPKYRFDPKASTDFASWKKKGGREVGDQAMVVRRFAFVCACALAVLVTAGCAWQRVPPPPFYHPTESIPLRAEARLLGDRSAVLNGERVLKNLQAWQVFESLSYPHRRRDKRDVFLTMEVTGAWDVPVAANNARSFLVGLSLGALSPVVGQTMTGRYQLVATLDVRGRTVAEYEIEQETPVSWGIGADGLNVAYKALDVEMAWLSYELAKRLKKDWPRISSEIGP